MVKVGDREDPLSDLWSGFSSSSVPPISGEVTQAAIRQDECKPVGRRGLPSESSSRGGLTWRSQTVERTTDPVGADVVEVARDLGRGSGTGPLGRRGQVATGDPGTEPARCGQAGAGVARVPAPVRGLHADRPAGRGGREPGGHRRDRDLGRAGRTDSVQRGRRAAPGVEGRGERQGAGADDEDDRPRTSRGVGDRDRRRRSWFRAMSCWSRPATGCPPMAG